MWGGGGGPQKRPIKSHFQQIVFTRFFYLFWHGIQDSQERRRYLTPDVSLRSRSQIESPGATPRPLLDLQVTRVADPDSFGSVDLDPDSESGSGSRRAKMTLKSIKNFLKVYVLKSYMASFES